MPSITRIFHCCYWYFVVIVNDDYYGDYFYDHYYDYYDYCYIREYGYYYY